MTINLKLLKLFKMGEEALLELANEILKTPKGKAL